MAPVSHTTASLRSTQGQHAQPAEVTAHKAKPTATAPVAVDSKPEVQAGKRDMSFHALADDFAAYHKNSLNVSLHLITTPGQLVGVLALVLSLFGQQIAGTVVAFYLGALMASLPWAYSFATMLSIGGIYNLTLFLSLGIRDAIILFTVSYLTQDLAHYLTSEPTFQSSYTPSTQPGQPKTNSTRNISRSGQTDLSLTSLTESATFQFYQTLFSHAFFLLPLCLDAAVRIRLDEHILEQFLVQDLRVDVKLTSEEDVKRMNVIKSWLDAQNLPKDITSHWWYASLPDHIREAFGGIASSSKIMQGFYSIFSAPAYTVQVVDAMNEIYVATLDTKNATSDNVFYSNHVDGPFLCYPFASVYRSIISINPNKRIKTIFPSKPHEKVLTTGDVLAFDFNREVHRIQLVDEEDPHDADASFEKLEQRYALKVHYLVYPTSMPAYGYLLAWLTASYDWIARLAFLTTIRPKTVVEKGLWAFIMMTTRLFFNILRAAGNSGAFSFIVAAACITYFIPIQFRLFLAVSSFVHYFIYIGTYYHQDKRDKICYEGFKHTVMFYKSIAFSQMFYLYYKHMTTATTFNPLSLLLVLCGFGLSASATSAIGLNRTYFGIELQHVPTSEMHYVTGFPYNLFQHPMILGNVVGLVGVGMVEGMRKDVPWLVPCHIMLYVVHCMQEHWRVCYRRRREDVKCE